MQFQDILGRLKALSNPESARGTARFGINPENNYGICIPDLRKLAREIGVDHALALQHWKSAVHEAHIPASMIDVPGLVTQQQMDSWVKDFESWNVCYQCCGNLSERTEFIYQKAVSWKSHQWGFIKRAGLAMMVCLAHHDARAAEEAFAAFVLIIKSQSTDDRNFVKKTINWALRQIGKRSPGLNSIAIETAEEIQEVDLKSAQWIASDAIRELTGKAAQETLRRFSS